MVGSQPSLVLSDALPNLGKLPNIALGARECACLCRPIMDGAEIQDIAKLMWEAPFAVLSHDLEESPDAPKYVIQTTS